VKIMNSFQWMRFELQQSYSARLAEYDQMWALGKMDKKTHEVVTKSLKDKIYNYLGFDQEMEVPAEEKEMKA
jgi:hypothetical protein